MAWTDLKCKSALDDDLLTELHISAKAIHHFRAYTEPPDGGERESFLKDLKRRWDFDSVDDLREHASPHAVAADCIMALRWIDADDEAEGHQPAYMTMWRQKPIPLTGEIDYQNTKRGQWDNVTEMGRTLIHQCVVLRGWEEGWLTLNDYDEIETLYDVGRAAQLAVAARNHLNQVRSAREGLANWLSDEWVLEQYKANRDRSITSFKNSAEQSEKHLRHHIQQMPDGDAKDAFIEVCADADIEVRW